MTAEPWMIACAGVLAVVTLGRWAWARAMEPLREPVRCEGLPVVVGSMEVNDERYVQRDELPALVRAILATYDADRHGSGVHVPVAIPNPKDHPSLAELERRGARS